jgi:gluconolactonase
MKRLIFALILSAGCSSPQLDPAPAGPGVFRPSAQDRIVPAGASLETLWEEGEFTEGPAVAPDGAIYFSDIGNRILKFDPKTRRVSVAREPSGRANGLMFDPQGRLVACEGASGGNRRVSITEASGEVRTLADRWQGKRFNSPNDLVIDRAGRVYFTDPRYVGSESREIDFEGVFLVTPDGSVALATRDVQKPNGIVLSPDGATAYVADNNPNGNRHLAAFGVRPDGTLGDKRVLFDFGAGKRGIDGMAVDVGGNVYATAGTKDLAGVYVFGPKGETLAYIRTPGDPTNCVFGIGNEAKTLYITAQGSKRFGLFRIRLAHEGFHPARPR